MKTTVLFSSVVLGFGIIIGQAVAWAAAVAPTESEIAAYRVLGQRGIEQLIDRDRTLLNVSRYSAVGRARPEVLAAHELLDAVCAQRDCYSSRLFWFTDLDQAKAEARRIGRPILSLHLLGSLNEEFSCANSRFFRAILYSDPRIAAALRKDFVLHWWSERKAPRISVNFGDGRHINTTITGNSIHYVLNIDGEVVDGIPGLVAPDTFLSLLKEGKEAALAPARPRSAPSAGEKTVDLNPQPGGRRTAEQASSRTVSKTATELPLLASFRRRPRGPVSLDLEAIPEPQPATISHEAAQLMRQIHGDDESFPAASQAFLISLNDDTEMNLMLRQLFLRKLDADRTGKEAAQSALQLNRWVYAELFLAPLDDPWLGLTPLGTFAGIPVTGDR